MQLSRGPNPGRRQGLSWSVELAWFTGLLAFAFLTTQFLLDAPPWNTVPVTFYGSLGASHVVPLPFLLRASGSLVAIRLGPILASAAFSRRGLPSTRTAAIGGLIALASATLAYLDSREFPAAPYVFALFVLDLALSMTFAIVALESLNAEPHGFSLRVATQAARYRG